MISLHAISTRRLAASLGALLVLSSVPGSAAAAAAGGGASPEGLDAPLVPTSATAPDARTHRGRVRGERKPSAAFGGAPEFASAASGGDHGGAAGAPERKTAASSASQASSADDGVSIGSADLFAASSESDQREMAEWRAQISTPRPGSTLTPTQTFAWTSGTNAQTYWLWVGSCQDCTDLYDGNLGLRRQETVAIPADGRRIYVTLFTLLNGEWWWYDYQYTAPSRTGARAELLQPAVGSTLGASETFTWSSGNNVDHYWLWVGSCQDCTDILDESQGQRRSRTVSLPLDGRVIYVTLFSLINGDWYWVDYQFRAGIRTTATTRVTLEVTNQLLYAVNLKVNGQVVGSVPAGETRQTSQDVAAGTAITLAWDLVRPTVSGRAIGDAMTGRFSPIERPSGRYTFTIDNEVGDSRFFLPWISNRTPVSMLIEVNGDLQAENRCDCTAPANTENIAAGYYRLFSNSNLRLYRAGSNYTGRYIYWSNFASRVEANTGRYRVVATSAP